MNQPSDPISTANVERLVLLIQLLGETLHLAADRARVRQTMEELIESPRFIADGGPLEVLRQAAPHLGLDFAANDLSSTDAWAMVADGFPVVICLSETHFLLLERISGMRLEASELERDEHRRSTLSSADLRAYWGRESTRRCLMVNRSMHQAADTVAGHHGDGLGGHGHGHPKPMKRFLTLLRLETRDILTLALFGLVSGVLGLATPLAVESLVNTVAWGTYLQPLFVLSLILFGFLSFAGTLKLLQVIIAEVVQRRVFVRIVGDLAHRFPLAKRDSLVNEHPSELANRYFDIMTIQKATASLLLDGISIVLQTVIGMLLLAVYHPFLLGFDIILLVTMTLFTYLLGRGGVRTAIDESKIKYEMAHWLQDVLSMPTAFRLHGGSEYAVEHANQLTVAYILGRTRHFQVLARQYAFSLILLAIASTALLGVGGWLVIRGELTLGQLVAAELVVTAIVSAFAKIGKSLEVFYDLLAAFDKVGHLVDVPCDLPIVLGRAERNPAAIRFQGLPIAFQGMAAEHVETIAPGSRIALTGPSGSGKSRFLEILSGLHEPVEGFAEIAGVDAREAARAASGAIVALARQPEIFAGSLLENIRLGRHWLSSAEIRLTLESVGLWEDILRLPNGLNTQLQTGGYPLTYAQCVRAMLARSLAGAPKVLLIDGILDLMDPDERWILWKQLTSMQESRTILVATHDQRIAKDCHRLLQCGRRSPATRQPIGTSS